MPFLLIYVVNFFRHSFSLSSSFSMTTMVSMFQFVWGSGQGEEGVVLKIDFGRTKAAFNWQFNPLLLNDVQFRQQTANVISDYLSQNVNSEVNDSSLWDAFKAVVRGHIIAYEAKLKKDRQKELSEINAQLPILERDYRMTASPFKLNEIVKLKFKYKLILADRVRMLLLKVKQKHFELADKQDKLLSRQLQTKTGTVTTNPKEINECLCKFCQDLYTTKTSADTAHISEFLRALHMPKLDPISANRLKCRYNSGGSETGNTFIPQWKNCWPRWIWYRVL